MEIFSIIIFSIDPENSEICKRRSSTRRSSCVKKKCFICNESRSIDDNKYNEGGLARCEMKPSADRLLDRSKEIKQLPEHRFYEAAMRFTVLHGGQSFDTLAVDIFYHISCYIKFAMNPVLNKRRQRELHLDEQI